MPQHRALVHGHRPRGEHWRRLPGHAIRQHHGLCPGVARLLHYSPVWHGDPGEDVEACHTGRRILGTALRNGFVDPAVDVGEIPSHGARNSRLLFARQAYGRKPVQVHLVLAHMRGGDHSGEPRDQAQAGFGTAGPGIRPGAAAFRTSRPVLSAAYFRSGDRRRRFRLPDADLLVIQLWPMNAAAHQTSCPARSACSDRSGVSRLTGSRHNRTTHGQWDDYYRGILESPRRNCRRAWGITCCEWIWTTLTAPTRKDRSNSTGGVPGGTPAQRVTGMLSPLCKTRWTSIAMHGPIPTIRRFSVRPSGRFSRKARPLSSCQIWECVSSKGPGPYADSIGC